MARTGVAFSGGGLRSASFCSGVLRRLLQKGSRMDYLSCVSGGGVTASSYLDWKFRHDQKDNPEWHKQFFDHMRKRIGVYIIWNNPCYGLLDTLLFIGVIILLSIIFPSLLWSSMAGPVAYMIDLAFGSILRGNIICSRNATLVLDAWIDGCKVDNEYSKLEPVLFLFLILVGCFIFFYLIKPFLGHILSPWASLLQTLSGFIFLMVFVPWIQQQFYTITDSFWLQLGIVIFSAVVMLSLPPFRGMASLVIMVYLYADIIMWRVYKTKLPLLGVRYKHDYFSYLMWISAIVLVFMPLIGVIQKELLHTLIRWKLQKAFYTRESAGWSGFAGIECSDLFPLPDYQRIPDMEARNRPLTLGDLEYIQPEFICNVLVDNWQIESAPDKPKYELLTLTPNVIERLDRRKGERQFEGLLSPADVKLSSAMAMSVAAVSLHMGVYQDQMESFRDIQAILGLTFGHYIVVGRKSVSSTIISFVLQLTVFGPVILFLLFRMFRLRLLPDKDVYVAVWVAINILICGIIALMPTGCGNPSTFERCVRWCVINIYHIRFIRDMLNVVNIGPIPPPVLCLSDGGHFENLGVLPLFKRRLERIVAVNGGATDKVEQSADDLLTALELARSKLNCSFTGLNGEDVIEDVRHKFVKKPPGKQPRSYLFRVEYHDKDSDTGENLKVGEGQVLLLFPRHPAAGTAMETHAKTWKEFGLDLDPQIWGTGPELEPEEVDRLTGCCCECCHSTSCVCLSRPLCGMFPNHSTANQCLTPEMFVAYHREGYRAFVEAAADDFLTSLPPKQQNITLIQVQPV